SPNFLPDEEPSTTTDWQVAVADGDGLLDGEEDANRDGRVDANHTDPNNADTEDDGLNDGLEVKGANPTNALLADTDADGLSDSREDFNRNGAFDDGETNPNNPDTDEGGLYDGEEVSAGLNPLSNADDLKIAGRGCNASGGELPLFAVLVLAVAALRRRRQPPVLFLLVGALFLLPATARAQAPSSTAIDVQQFKPGPSSDDLLGLHGAAVNKHLHWQVGLWTNYGHQPLGVINPSSDHFIGQIVRSQWTTDVVGAVGLFDRLELAVALPLTYQRGLTSTPATASVGGVDLRRFGLGDIRLVAKALVLKRDQLELGVAVPVMFPSGGADSFYGGMGVGAQPRIAGAWRTERLRVLVNLGVNLRRPQQLRNLKVGNELAYALGGEVQVIERVAVEATLAGAVGLLEQDPEELPLELLAAARYRINSLFSVTAGAGTGLSRGYGNPLFRVLAGVTFTPAFSPLRVESDADSDGIADARDRCRNQPEDRDGFEDTDGCPDLDNDQDALPDAADRCANEPETVNGFEDEDGCPDQQPLPPSDTDGDGFLDSVDKCPTSAEDKDGFEDEDGCPDPDNDRDGILDEADKCPDHPEVVNGTDDEDGCPDQGKAKVKLEGEKIIVLDKVYFATSKDIILPRSFPLLKQVHALLRAHPELKKIRVEGHTDSVGKKSKNLDLSQRRANNVRRFLVNQGIAEDRLEAVGYGDQRPIMPNTTIRGRERNRRVEFVVISDGG
ncbi:MAG: OmpA family protein, partial [Myxococcaceae bacterium]